MKDKLIEQKKEISLHRVSWQGRLDKLNNELDSASDRTYLEKRKGRISVQNQIDIAAKNEYEMQNYIDELEEGYTAQSVELKSALKAKRSAIKSDRISKLLAASRLNKWHDIRNKNRQLHEELFAQSKITTASIKIIEKYESIMLSSAAKKKTMKKEWRNAEHARHNGGKRNWPVWVVQLICELLVNGTPPSAIPANILTMYETLYGETTKDLPSVSFVRSCRVVVEVIGETVTAIKLARAGSWKQLWTDATTRRQIPFTALIIGLMGDDDKIDPVVVSSCIFMEDEKSDTGAEGIITKVSVPEKTIFFMHVYIYIYINVYIY
jgi:DNA polymerase III alpha subunit (gram-positive type)